MGSCARNVKYDLETTWALAALLTEFAPEPSRLVSPRRWRNIALTRGRPTTACRKTLSIRFCKPATVISASRCLAALCVLTARDLRFSITAPRKICRPLVLTNCSPKTTGTLWSGTFAFVPLLEDRGGVFSCGMKPESRELSRWEKDFPMVISRELGRNLQQ